MAASAAAKSMWCSDGVRAGEVEAGRGQGAGQEIRFGERDAARRLPLRAFPGQGDHPGVTVDRGDLGAAFGEPAGEQPVAAADLERGAAVRGDGPKDDRLVVDVVVPVAS